MASRAEPIYPELFGTCPVPYAQYDRILLGHGSGGRLTADRLLGVMRSHPLGKQAALIGEVVDDHPGLVTPRSVVGGERVVTMLAEEHLPRIC